MLQVEVSQEMSGKEDMENFPLHRREIFHSAGKEWGCGEAVEVSLLLAGLKLDELCPELGTALLPWCCHLPPCSQAGPNVKTVPAKQVVLSPSSKPSQKEADSIL